MPESCKDCTTAAYIPSDGSYDTGMLRLAWRECRMKLCCRDCYTILDNVCAKCQIARCTFH